MFDFDGLILDTETPLQLSWAEIYSEVGLSVPPAQWASLLGAAADPPGAYALLEEHLGHPIDRESVRRKRLRREHELLSAETILPGVMELVRAARSSGLRLAVASSSDRAWVEGHLRTFGLLSSFQVLLCAEDVTLVKPDPELYTATLRALGVRADEAIAFEDSVHGAAAARCAGLFVVVVPNRVTRHAVFPNADLVVDSIAERSLNEYIAAAGRGRHTSAK
ncbi:MAG: HAD-IA family hydrolase [Candidatus Bipolaricaulota bacterium]|nr:HAD-IA family hydrolase [Candidatus Bipolaricaulota bacterium]